MCYRIAQTRSLSLLSLERDPKTFVIPTGNLRLTTKLNNTIMKKKISRFTTAELLITIPSTLIILFFLLTPFPGAWVKKERAESALQKAGYSDVKITDRSNYFAWVRGGGHGDVVRFVCSAKNPAGKNVTDIYVFCGWPFKGTTIRTD